MKPAKSPRIGAPPHGRPSRGVEKSVGQASPTGRTQSSGSGEGSTEGRHGSSPNVPDVIPVTEDLEAMRHKMAEALAEKQQQQQQQQRVSPSGRSPSTAKAHGEGSGSGGLESIIPMASNDSQPSNTTSADSAKTIKAPFDMTPSSARTPSYPFPRMQLRLNRGTSHRSAPSHKPFTLLSPTNTPLQESASTPFAPADPGASEPSTSAGPTDEGEGGFAGESEYPTPDLYDMILMLNTEPGLEAWWANVTQILTEAYGVERASLAVPGDVTDLENVPWGQRATYNVYGSDTMGSSHHDSTTPSELDLVSHGKRPEPHQTRTDSANTQARPSLQSRHSIAGVLPELAVRGSRQRPQGPVRAHSNMSAQREEREAAPGSPRLSRRPVKSASSTASEHDSPIAKPFLSSSASTSSTLRCMVHRSLQPLEAEPDALLVRTGVSALFGKRKPIVLTRAYTQDDTPAGPQMGVARSRAGLKARTDSNTSEQSQASREESGQPPKFFRMINEFEQPEPSPWSQSPAPSPAARPDPSESPFFAHSATIDETAFDQNPPTYDYPATANQSLRAIGADASKTLIHVPLIQPVPSRGALASSLRFPIAILSILSPINPYPRSLRDSLTQFLPHMAGTYSLALQFSKLFDSVRGPPARKQSAAFGLGGTFSDEGSELELVAELSEQLALERGKDKYSAYSPSDRTSTSKDSLPGSTTGTPSLEHMGFKSGQPTTPVKSGLDMVDSYFSAKRLKSGMSQNVTTPGQIDETPEKRKSSQKPTSGLRGQAKKVAIAAAAKQDAPVAGARRASITNESDAGDASQVSSSDKTEQSGRGSREADERPLPELISQLMLNSVPLQLFLAKPKTGVLVWTNRKFDAFRSQGDERVKDPWKNVHEDDRPDLVRGWQETLKSGNQYTHYVRVKRFNSDSDFRWFIFRASTLLSANGQLLYWIGSFLDVHEQHMKSLELSEKEATVARDAKLRALADAIPQILFEALEGEGIVHVNQQWHAFSGQLLEDAVGLGFAKHVHREDLYKCGIVSPADAAIMARLQGAEKSSTTSSSSSNKTVQPTSDRDSVMKSSWSTPDMSQLERLVATGVIGVERDENGRLSYSTEIRLRSKGGEFRWFLVRLVKVESKALAPGKSSWYGTCTDIDVRKGLEKELNRANKKVHEEMESKTKFFANMSHEIRTPLNGILGSMPWLVESALDHDQRRTVDTIQNSSNNLRELVDNILDVTKVEAGKMTLVYKWFHVRTLLEEIIDTVSSRAIERGLELNYTVDANVPGTVKGDPFRVRQVLLNLLGNGVKFTEQGEVYVKCYIKGQPASTASDAAVMLLAFDVIDTGRGFNPADFQRLFKQFGQLDGGSNHDAGSGLGLFLSKQLVEMHGGELSVQSQAGEGSTFTFFIKVEIGDEAADVTVKPVKHPARALSTGSPRSRSDGRTPTMSMSRGINMTPGLSRYVTSPEAQSPAMLSSGSSDPAIRSSSSYLAGQSSMSSMFPTPESGSSSIVSGLGERQVLAEQAMAKVPAIRRSSSEVAAGALAPTAAHPTTYSVIVICPAEHARNAIKQHIEQVVPHSIAVNVTAVADVGTFSELVHGPASPTFTHIVLDLPATSDIMLFMRQMMNFTATIVPSLIVITDHYQKRDIIEDYTALTQAGRKAYLVHKPVKPSVFAMIFDPAQLRNLSKDYARDMAQSRSDDFKNTAETVKRKIGNKAFRLLLVEDSDVNRQVILRYFKKIEIASETATNGLECTEMVLGRPHGYYSLIICDIQMPRKNGYEACAEIRAWERNNAYPPLPIMALTANAMPEERAAAAQAGFTDYLTKPVDFNVLGNMLLRLLDAKVAHVFLKDRPPES